MSVALKRTVFEKQKLKANVQWYTLNNQKLSLLIISYSNTFTFSIFLFTLILLFTLSWEKVGFHNNYTVLLFFRNYDLGSLI